MPHIKCEVHDRQASYFVQLCGSTRQHVGLFLANNHKLHEPTARLWAAPCAREQSLFDRR